MKTGKNALAGPSHQFFHMEWDFRVAQYYWDSLKSKLVLHTIVQMLTKKEQLQYFLHSFL
jgi:hypothetical protein